nr:LacI family DNA-binding transcriptional regulator [Nakamurella flavida]
MADIAAHLGVSRQLVSIVLRDMPGASDATRRRVTDAARELGYSLNLGARTLRQSRSRQLGVSFVPVHPTEPDVVAAMYPAAAALGYQVVLSAQTGSRTTGECVEELMTYRCAAIIVIGSDLSAGELADLAERCGVPLVVVGTAAPDPRFDVVRSTGAHGLSGATDHLVQLGHRAIAYVHSPGLPVAPDRRRGHLRAMRSHGLATDIITTRGPDYTEEAGAAAARGLLARATLPTAVMAANDQAAIGMLGVLARAGVRVPQDVSVSGFDDSRVAQLSCFDLTTVRQDPGRMGAAAVSAAVRRADAPALAPQTMVVETELVVRTSTGPPRVR